MRRIGPGVRVFKTALAAGLSYVLAAYVSQNHYPYFAPLAVVLVLGATIADTFDLALYRMSGIVGGVIVSMAIGYWFHVGALTIALTIFLGMALGAVLHLDPHIVSQMGVTSLLVLVSKDTHHYAVDRILETALGAAVAIVINIAIIPPNEVPQAERRVRELAEVLARTLRDLAQGVQDDNRVTEIKASTGEALRAVESAQRSVRLTPFLRGRRARLRRLAAVAAALEKMAIQVRGILRGLSDLRADRVTSEGMTAALHEVADCVAAFGAATISPSGETQQALASAISRALANEEKHLAQLTQVQPPTAVRDLGAIFADLNRILIEVREVQAD
ncbi:MAG: FUSC family protein [Symbiobacteriia bacterium]